MRLYGWLCVFLGLSLLVSSGCGGSAATQTYSARDVKRAFATAGYPVVETPIRPGNDARPEGTYLTPRKRAPLWVFVATDQEADDAWAGYVEVGGDEDSLTVRRANVVAISDGGLAPVAKTRVRKAMHLLPERGYAVDVLEDH